MQTPGAALQTGWSKASEVSAKPGRRGAREAAVPKVHGCCMHVKLFQLPSLGVLQLPEGCWLEKPLLSGL